MSVPIVLPKSTESLDLERIKSLKLDPSFSNYPKLTITDKGDIRTSNYHSWVISTENLLRAKGIMSNDSTLVTGTQDYARDLVVSMIDSTLLPIIPSSKLSSYTALWKYLPVKCKIGNRWDLEAEFDRLTGCRIDMDKFIEKIDEHVKLTARAGGSITVNQQFNLLMRTAHPKLYQSVISNYRKKQLVSSWEINEKELQNLKDDLAVEFESTPKEVLEEYIDKKPTANNANNVQNRPAKKTIPLNEQCEYCKKHRKDKPRLAQSHRTSSCFFGDRPGFERSGNKADQNYSKSSSFVYLDTGCSNGSFVKDKPKLNFIADTSYVTTANNSTAKIEGHGTFKVGSVSIDTHWVPTFQKNLINDSDILKTNKCIVITKNRFAVLSDESDLKVDPENITATGTRHTNDLLAFDDAIDKSVLQSDSKFNGNVESNSNVLHRTLGHVGIEWINRTIKCKGADGLPTNEVNQLSTLCEICETTKGRQGNIPKHSKTSFLPGEAVVMDSQGPFQTIAYDGTKANMKIIDYGSGYIQYCSVNSINGENAINLFNTFIAKVERRTGRKVKYLYTDDGKEFKEPLLSRINQLGIVKRKGTPYQHHNPGKVERSHQTVMQMGRSMLKESKLPLKYYPLSHRAAVYLSNRLVHFKQTKSPYEMINTRKPDLSYVVPFGSICYATTVPEQRNGKLDDTGFRGRIVGYGDEDEVEERKAYYVLRETDQTLHWIARRNVRIDLASDIIPLPNILEDEQNDHGEDIFSDPNYVLEDEEPTDIETPDNSSLLQSSETDMELPQSTESNRPHGSDESYQPSGNSTVEEESNYLPSGESYHPTETESDYEFDPDVEFADREWYTSNYSWFNPHAKNAKFRIDFATGARKIGLPPDLLFAVFSAVNEEELTYEEAMRSEDAHLYLQAMQLEFDGMLDQRVYDLADMPADRKAIKGKWVFRKKYDMFGELIKIKARWVGKGFTQIQGKDYFETFAAVAKMKSVRVFLSICTALDLEVYQHDVPQAFLGTDLEEEIWMDQIKGFEDGTSRKCKLRKTLYGLKQSPREFNKSVDKFLKDEGFTQSVSDSCVYVKRDGAKVIFFLLYVDDCLVAGNDKEFTTNFQNNYKRRFKIVEPTKLASWFLGLHIERDEEGRYSINQNQYVKDKLKLFDGYIGNGKASRALPDNVRELLEKAESSDDVEQDFPYRRMVGSLMYAMTGTRFDIAFALSVVSKFLANPKRIHCDLVRHIFKYLKGNPELAIKFNKSAEKKVVAECYADAAYENHLHYRSTLGHCMTINKVIVDWSSKCQTGVPAQSSTEAEYLCAVKASNNIVWFRELLDELGFPQGTVKLYEDNEACIKLSKNPQDHSRTKHIPKCYHIIRQHVKDKSLELVYIPTREQFADILTKSLSGALSRPIVEALSQGGN